MSRKKLKALFSETICSNNLVIEIESDYEEKIGSYAESL